MTDKAWHKCSAETVARRLEVDPATGLDQPSVRRRRERHGSNRLGRRQPLHRLGILLRQFRSIVILTDKTGTLTANRMHLETLALPPQAGDETAARQRALAVGVLCTNFAEVASVALATLAGAPLPLLPLQILYLNVLTDVFPALALAVGAAPAGIMQQPPRPAGEAILSRQQWLAIAAWSSLIAATILAVLYLALTTLGLDRASAVTVSFLTLGFSKLWFVFALREPATAPWRGTVAGNRWIWMSLAVCAVLLVAAVHLPGLSRMLGTAAIGGAGWLLVIAASLVALLLGELRRLALALRR